MIKTYFFVFFFLIWDISFSQSATLYPVQDNTIHSENSNASNGAGLQFFTGRIGPNGGSAIRRGLIKFNVSSVPAGAVITSATLKIVCFSVPPNAVSNLVELHKCLASWGEGTSSGLGQGATATVNDATWTCRFANGTGGCTNLWTTAGGDFAGTISSSVTVTTAGDYTFASSTQLVADVQSWVNAPASNFGWILKGNEITEMTARGFTSREGSATASVLTITYSTQCTTATWTGAVSSAWEVAGNWSCGSVPDANTDVIINSGTVTLNSNRSCRSISVNPGAVFTVASGFTLTIAH